MAPSHMETKFRPIPVTIIDFLGILVPGFVWLVLLVATFDVLLGSSGAPAAPLLSSFQKVVEFQKSANSWVGAVSLFFAALTLGWIFKPIAMRTSEHITKWMLRFIKDTRKIKPEDARFPFLSFFCDTDYYREVAMMLKSKLKCNPETLPGSHTFAAAKRFLRLVAPSLWEESERMEAEVRMTGGLFLAAVYSAILIGCTILAHYLGGQTDDIRAGCLWFVLSAVLSFALGASFIRLRFREVGYTYLNALIAARFSSQNPSRLSAKDQKGVEE
jgi:hypothetical protein